MNTMDNITRRSEDEDYEDYSHENANSELENEENDNNKEDNIERATKIARYSCGMYIIY